MVIIPIAVSTKDLGSSAGIRPLMAPTHLIGGITSVPVSDLLANIRCDALLFQGFDRKRRSTWFSKEIPRASQRLWSREPVARTRQVALAHSGLIPEDHHKRGAAENEAWTRFGIRGITDTPSAASGRILRPPAIDGTRK